MFLEPRDGIAQERARPGYGQQLVEEYIDKDAHKCRHRQNNLPRLARFHPHKADDENWHGGDEANQRHGAEEGQHPTKEDRATQDDFLVRHVCQIGANVHVDFLFHFALGCCFQTGSLDRFRFENIGQQGQAAEQNGTRAHNHRNDPGIEVPSQCLRHHGDEYHQQEGREDLLRAEPRCMEVRGHATQAAMGFHILQEGA